MVTTTQQTDLTQTNEMVTDQDDQPFTLEEPLLEALTHYPDRRAAIQVQEGEQEEPTERVRTLNPTNERRYSLRNRAPTSFYQPGMADLSTAFVSTVHGDEPSTVREALSMQDSEQWKAAIRSELNSLHNHATWTPTNLPHGHKALSTRFVFRKKHDSQGSVIRHKARLVVRGHLQGDVKETYAPVVDFTTVRTALTVAVQRGYSILQLDICTAFLHGDIDGDVYITPPDGVDVCEERQVLKLRRGLYGLKQAPRLWNQKWLEVMNKMGFVKLRSDECAFNKGTVWILLYVDDIILIGPDDKILDAVKEELRLYLDGKDMGVLSGFLGLHFTRDSGSAWLSKKSYTMDVLKRFGMEQCKAIDTPMSTGTLAGLNQDNSGKFDTSMYQELIGCLLFLSTRTRPDISACVGILCRFSANPTKLNWVQLKRILRYLNGTINFALRIGESSETKLRAFSDSDWARDRVDRKSTTGVLLRLSASTLCWKTAKQNSVALSTTEAEHIALSEATKLVIWMRRLLAELGCHQKDGTEISEDNQGAIVWSTEGVRNAKHISIRRNFVKENVEKEVIQVVFCPTENMTADILTKPLGRISFHKHREGLSLFPLNSPAK